MAWLLVMMAGIFETGFAVLLKQSHGITRLAPPASVWVWAACATAAAIAGLTLWTRWRSGQATTASALSPSDR